MTEIQATVIALDGLYALVRTEQQGGCGRCNEPGGCGGNNLVQMMCSSSAREYRVLNPDGAKVGEIVTVSISEGVVGRSALIIYVVPLVSFVVGALLVGLFSSSNWLAVLGSGVCGGLSWMIVRRIQRAVALDARFYPSIHRRLAS
jgi:sigma-E factor negative regulatory protein RseC